MRHRKDTVKLSRTRSHRAALYSNMTTSLFKHERMKTTVTKAQIISRVAEHMISLAQKNTLASRRQVATVVKDQSVLKKLFDVIVPRMKDKKSGFIRIVKLWPRHGDAALLAVMELYGAPDKVKAVENDKKPVKNAPKKKIDKKLAKTDEKTPREKKSEKKEEKKK